MGCLPLFQLNCPVGFAFAIWSQLNQKHTGFAVVDRQTGNRESGVESAHVTFLPMSDDEIARYVATGEPLDKAGAYGIQGHGALFVASIMGDFYTVMGLPLARLGRAFSSLGYELL